MQPRSLGQPSGGSQVTTRSLFQHVDVLRWAPRTLILRLYLAADSLTNVFLVIGLSRPALLGDRNEDIPLRPDHELCLLRDGRKGGQGKHVCRFTFCFLEARVGLKMIDRVLTRPYVSGKLKEGSQCPMIVTPYVPAEST